jgi:prevent-host-death family protein
MEVTNIHQAKTHLSRLIERVVAGEEVVIAKAGKPVVRLVPYQENATPKRKLGVWKGKVKIKSGFDKLPKSMMDAFLGKLPLAAGQA